MLQVLNEEEEGQWLGNKSLYDAYNIWFRSHYYIGDLSLCSIEQWEMLSSPCSFNELLYDDDFIEFVHGPIKNIALSSHFHIGLVNDLYHVCTYLNHCSI
jgi:hypothetical protein